MEGLSNPFTIILFLCRLCFAVISGIMFKFPPKKINMFYGYKTSSSMKSQHRWDFAQIYSFKLLVKTGVFLMLISLLGYFINLSDLYLHLIVGLIIITSAIILLVQTEKLSKENLTKIY